MYHLLDASFRKMALICTGTDGFVDWDLLRPAMGALDDAYSASFTADFPWNNIESDQVPTAYEDYQNAVKEIVATCANGARHANITTRVEEAFNLEKNPLLLPLPSKKFVEFVAERLKVAPKARFEVSALHSSALLWTGWPNMAEGSAMFKRADPAAHSGGLRHVQVCRAGCTWRSPPPCAANRRT
jgi:hypothetical protein